MANVGDMKNEELPLQFFLDYAWNPTRCRCPRLRCVGAAVRRGELRPGQLRRPIADVLHTTGMLQSRRKPELLNRQITVDPAKDLATDPSAVIYDDQATPFSLTDYRELDRVTAQWQPLAARAEADRTAAAAGQAGRLLRARAATRSTATANLYALRRRRVHQHPVRRAGPGAHQRPGRHCRGALRRRPGADRLLQQRRWPAGSGRTSRRSRTSTTATWPGTARTRPGSSRS